MWKKHKAKIIVAIAVIAVLVAAFFMGGDLGNTEKEAEIPETEISQESTPKTPTETDRTPKPQVEKQPAEADNPEKRSEQEQAEPGETEEPEQKTTMEIDPETGKDQYMTDPVPEGKPEPVEPQEAELTDAVYTCTISISCATILDNIKDLNPEKVELVPEDGWLMEPEAVTFQEGESVFDVLLRVCQKQKIHMEYVNTPMYNSAYIEGIGNLYEFDCGSLSGWMYNVNGWFPNYGCSRYALQEGDIICWVYTCDLGADVGDNSMSN